MRLNPTSPHPPSTLCGDLPEAGGRKHIFLWEEWYERGVGYAETMGFGGEQLIPHYLQSHSNRQKHLLPLPKPEPWNKAGCNAECYSSQ